MAAWLLLANVLAFLAERPRARRVYQCPKTAHDCCEKWADNARQAGMRAMAIDSSMRPGNSPASGRWQSVRWRGRLSFSTGCNDPRRPPRDRSTVIIVIMTPGTDHIYLDHNATTPMLPQVAEAMVRASSIAFGNPASQHWAGRKSRQILEDARDCMGVAAGSRRPNQPRGPCDLHQWRHRGE